MGTTDKGPLTADNCAVIFIDHQPQMVFGVANMDGQAPASNTLLLAKTPRSSAFGDHDGRGIKEF